MAHPDFGEGVTAVVVLEKEGLLDAKQILETLSDRLAKFKQPKIILFEQQLPRNAMGKVQKQLLRQTYKDIYQSS